MTGQGSARYGLMMNGPNKGTYTRCRAKNPDNCKYHSPGSHVMLTRDELDAAQENAIAVSMSGGMTRSNTVNKPVAGAVTGEQNKRGATVRSERQPEANTATVAPVSAGMQDMNRGLLEHAPETAEEYQSYYDRFFNGVTPINGWKPGSTMNAYHVNHSIIKYGSPADDYTATFTNTTTGETMTLTVERESGSSTVLGGQLRITSPAGARTVITVPPEYCDNNTYQQLWADNTGNHGDTTENDNNSVSRELIVTRDGSIIGYEHHPAEPWGTQRRVSAHL